MHDPAAIDGERLARDEPGFLGSEKNDRGGNVVRVAAPLDGLAFEHHAPGANIHNYGNALWWAIVTITTVGYGDVTPHTVLGRVLACFIMIMGYGMIAVPTTV